MENYFSSWKVKEDTQTHVWLWELQVKEDEEGELWVTLWCKTSMGNSVTVYVHGWKPWFRILSRDKIISPFKKVPSCIVSMEPQKVHKLYGWEHEDNSFDTRLFHALEVKVNSLRSSAYAQKEVNPSYLVCDTLQQPRTRFLHDTGLSPCAWFSVKEWTGDDNMSCCVHVSALIPDLACEIIPPLTIASFDCEMSSSTGLLPSPYRGDTVFCISTVFGKLGNAEYKTVTIYLGDVASSSESSSHLVCVRTFKELFETWSRLIRHVDPDMVTGWNTEGFDFAFLAKQYDLLFVPPEQRGTEEVHLQAWKKAGYPRVSIKDLVDRLSNAEKRLLFVTLPSSIQSNNDVISLFKLGDGSLRMEDDDEDSIEESIFLNPAIHLPVRDVIENFLEKKQRLGYARESGELPGEPAVQGLKNAYRLGREREMSGLVSRTMSTAAKGDNIIEKIPMEGRVVFDMMRVIKDDQKPASNSLRYAADTWLPSSSKLDMPVEELFRIYREKDADKARDVITYCERDAEIPLRLIFKLQYITSWIGLSRVCYLNPDAIINGGQQTRVFSLLSRRIRHTHAVNKEASGWPLHLHDYVGATVIEPEAGFFTDPISTLDFASLYPSIIGSNNLCFSTLVTNRSLLSSLRDAKGKSLYQDFEIEHRNGDDIIKKRYAFVTHVPSVLADALIHLLAERKVVKQQMEATSDEFLAEVLNKRQLALKVVCNSVYGFTGVDVDKGLLSCKPVAAVTTLIGRKLIGMTKDFVESHYSGSKVVYGDTDSVMILWGTKVLQEAFYKGEQAAKEVTQYLRTVMEEEQGSQEGTRNISKMCQIVKLEHEKEYWPYLLLKKKNYAGRKWTPSSYSPLVLKDKIDMKGIQAVRRDTIPFVASLSRRIIDALLLECSSSKAMEYVRNTLQKVAVQELPLEDYIISKSLSGSYVNGASLPHVNAWNRMKQRGDADIPGVGGRIPFVYIHGNKKLAERAEHPLYVKANNISLDTQYYINAAFNPTQKLLQFFQDGELKDVFAEAQNQAVSKHTTSLLQFVDAEDAPVHHVQSPPPKKKRITQPMGLDAFLC